MEMKKDQNDDFKDDSTATTQTQVPSLWEPQPQPPTIIGKREPEEASILTVKDEPPNGGYGWTFGVFLAHYLSTNTYPGATALEYAFVGGLSISVSFITAPVATWILGKYGSRTTIMFGVAFQTIALIAASFTNQIWQLFLTQGACFGIGMGFLFTGSISVPSQWFTTRRNIANGIATGGSGIGAMVYNLATGAMIENIGLPWAFRVLGILSFTCNFISGILIRDRNKAIGVSTAPFSYKLFRRLEFNLYLAWGISYILGYVVLLFSLPSYATSIGLSTQQGSIIGALLNLGQGIGRPLIGMFGDAVGPINIATAASFVCGLLCLVVWIFAKSYGVLIFFALIVGTVSGTYWTAVAPVGAEVVGLKELPACLSLTWLVLVLPTTFSEPIALEMRSKTGDVYLHPQIFAGCIYIISGLFVACVRAWKVRDLKRLEAEKGDGDVNVVKQTSSFGWRNLRRV
ncbi:MAG: hypothetical protein M1834_001980 [Cirrosporium novae-zelandiae]|nr:MAG: hypothetical protein M1834_001980 [Cirrosporium novae-zelandiae]